jgi:hypothetical protein
MNEYKCIGKCEKTYHTALDYSDLETIVKDNGMCCKLPLWYSPDQVMYMKNARPETLKGDYAKFLQDLLTATTVTPEGQYKVRF